MDAFFSWFQSQNGTVDLTALRIDDIPGSGRGAIAVRDLPEGYILFSIPRELTLSTRTSQLPAKLGLPAWKRFRLHVGWAGLILCMMWEGAQGVESKWHGYMSILPSEFDTPMFWSASELEELKGTAVVGKIGKSDAENDFHQKIVPVIQSRPDLFPPASVAVYYTLDRYYITGSRILSRSFQVSKWEGEGDAEDDQDDGDVGTTEADVSVGSAAMDVDEGEDHEQLSTEDGSDDGDGDEEDSSDVAMVPVADMLNARYGAENSKLFYEERNLQMITTKAIKKGEQIWNTYGNPPNSDLLRRYGHVDILPLEPPLTGEGNPADNVEVPANLVVNAVSTDKTAVFQERIDWWLEEVEDDTFVIFSDCELPKELISLIRLLLQPDEDWQKTQSKGKLPKAVIDRDVLAIAVKVLEARLAEYPTTIEADEALLADDSLSRNRRNAVIVRLGEKHILAATLRDVRIKYGSLEAEPVPAGSKRKHTDTGQTKSAAKKTRR